IIRSIRASPAFEGQIYGLAYDAKEPAIYLKDACDKVFLIPYPSSGKDSLFQRLNYIIGNHPIDFMIPSLDSELNSFLSLEEDLKDMGVKMFLPTNEMLEARAKKHLNKICTQSKISYPKTKEINGYDRMARTAAEIGYPLVVKGVFYEATVVYSLAELEKAAYSIAGRWGFPLLLQEFIKGEEFDIAVVGDGKGGMLGLTSMKKMQLTSKGKAWGGMTLDSSEIVTNVKRILKALKWRGPMEIEIMKRQSDGKFFLIEINPRFPAWIYLGQGSGCNLP
ncbi:ATP-grasp domain-containing protein, partial [bacterium]|nr:ATP-grasp domain-containing protein [bacterium]